MKEALTIVHNPPEYKMEVRVSEFADKDVLADRHIVIRTGDLGAIALNENEVKQVIDWLVGWLEEKK